MDSITIVGLPIGPDSRLSEDAHARLRGADRVLVPAADESAAAAVAERGLAHGTLELPVDAPLHEVVRALTALAEQGDVAFVTSAFDGSLHVPPSPAEPPASFEEFVRLIAVLRGPDGCPWDKEQTHMSLRKNMIEEAYEVVTAIEEGVVADLAEELGDVLLQVVLHSQMASEVGDFTIDDVIAGIDEKIRRRHPHIFGEATAGTAAEVIAKWDVIKREEKAEKGGGILEGVPKSLPSLMYAQKISRRAVAAGFEWPDIEGVWRKVHEEIEELKAARPDTPEVEEELGDLLFTIVNLARKLGVDAETALRGTCEKFIRRFEDMERTAAERGVALPEMSSEGMEELWELAKRRERGSA